MPKKPATCSKGHDAPSLEALNATCAQGYPQNVGTTTEGDGLTLMLFEVCIGEWWRLVFAAGDSMATLKGVSVAENLLFYFTTSKMPTV